jgi:fatty acyl-CoA reductase
MDKQILIEEADIFLNCAASVDFNAKLHDAIGINVNGTLRMMDLAKQAKKVKNFVHVSTCYVNSDKRGWIEEEIYDSPVNARQLMEDILKIPAA